MFLILTDSHGFDIRVLSYLILDCIASKLGKHENESVEKIRPSGNLSFSV